MYDIYQLMAKNRSIINGTYKIKNGRPKDWELDPEPERPFRGRYANDWIADVASKPIPRMLFDEFWIEGELCVLFATSNVGKSILAVQIADQISKGITVHPFKLTTGRHRVLFFDFELSDRQFAKRYSEENNGRLINPYQFDPFFVRNEREPASPPEGQTITDFYIDNIEQEIKEHKAKVVIIDNITWLQTRLERASDAGPFMQRLNNLKKKYDLSILIIAHTPKRDATQELTLNDLSGSSVLMNFLDSAFAIGKSRKDPYIRYLKQVKVRYSEHRYHSENVIVCNLEKDHNFLGYNFLEYSEESEHLRKPTDNERSSREERIIELYQEIGTFSGVGKELGLHPQTIKRVVEKYQKNSFDEEFF